MVCKIACLVVHCNEHSLFFFQRYSFGLKQTSGKRWEFSRRKVNVLACLHVIPCSVHLWWVILKRTKENHHPSISTEETKQWKCITYGMQCLSAAAAAAAATNLLNEIYLCNWIKPNIVDYFCLRRFLVAIAAAANFAVFGIAAFTVYTNTHFFVARPQCAQMHRLHFILVE